MGSSRQAIGESLDSAWRSLAVMNVFAGFLISPKEMGWLRFVHYISPFAWELRSNLQNEVRRADASIFSVACFLASIK